MTKLNPTHRGLLEAANASPEGAADDIGYTNGAISSLIKRGFLISVPKPEGGRRLLITAAGRAIIACDAPTPPADLAVTPSRPTAPAGKLGVLVELLQRPGGASLADMMTATGWQRHSIRGALSGALKKGRGLSISSQKTDGCRLYRIAAEPMA